MRHCLLCLLLSAVPLYSQDAPPALTIYNQDFAVVRELIPLDLKIGANSVRFAGVTAHLEPESVMLRDCSGGQSPRLLEQNYHPPVSQQNMLTNYQGQTIEFLTREGDRQQIVSGKIIRPGSAYDPGVARRYGQDFYPVGYYNPQVPAGDQGFEQPLIEINGKLRFSLPGTPIFPTPADQSIFHPEINWLLESSRAGSTRCELSYVTGGMTWQADYNVIAPATASSRNNIVPTAETEPQEALDLIGWVTLDNHSGRAFPNARIKLMAGDIHKIQAGRIMAGVGGGVGIGVIGGLAGQPMITEKAFDEYHLYTLEQPTTLRDTETKQVEFLRRTGIPSRRVYIYSGFVFNPDPNTSYQPEYLRYERWFGATSNPKVWVMQEIRNLETDKLGIPLPRGRMRFYRQDDSGQLEFIGENSIDHTPRGETLRVYTGNAFDLLGERRRTEFKIDAARENADESFEIKVKNHKKSPVEVIVLEHLYRGVTWQITSASAKYNKKDAQTIEFPIEITPDGEATVAYTVHYSW